MKVCMYVRVCMCMHVCVCVCACSAVSHGCQTRHASHYTTTRSPGRVERGDRECGVGRGRRKEVETSEEHGENDDTRAVKNWVKKRRKKEK